MLRNLRELVSTKAPADGSTQPGGHVQEDTLADVLLLPALPCPALLCRCCPSVQMSSYTAEVLLYELLLGQVRCEVVCGHLAMNDSENRTHSNGLAAAVHTPSSC